MTQNGTNTLKNWSLNNIPDLSGKIVLVTGGNSGLGYLSVKAFAEKGAEVIMGCRSVKKAEVAKNELLKKNPRLKITVIELDLSDLWSIKVFSILFNKTYNRLDILMNNAGVMLLPYWRTSSGEEFQQAVNYFGHFTLTALLLPRLRSTPDSRVVNVSGLSYKIGSLNFKNMLFKDGNGYSAIKAYSRSKLQNLLFTLELQRYFDSNNIHCKAMASHPGLTNTQLFRYINNKLSKKIVKYLIDKFGHSAESAVLTQIRAAVDPDAKGGSLFAPDGPYQLKGNPIIVKAQHKFYNKENAASLWAYSQKLMGVRFPEMGETSYTKNRTSLSSNEQHLNTSLLRVFYPQQHT